MKKYDAVIIGVGKAGKTLAIDMARRGMSVAVVEKEESMFGGTCINVGCIPTKFLILESIINSKHPYKSFDDCAKTYAKTVESKSKMSETFRNKLKATMESFDNLDIYMGNGSFVDNHTILIENGSEKKEIYGNKIFINTGAKTFYPPIKGLENNEYVYDSRKILNLTKLPKTLTIIGAGYIGLEFAGMYKNFGTKVVMLEANNVFLPREDRDVAEAIFKSMEDRDIEIKLGVKINEIVENKINIEEDGKSSIIESDIILCAVGRRPNTQSLNLANAGIDTNARGGIEVDDNLRTTASNVWAMGDVHDGLQFTYTSLDDYRIVRDELFGDGEYSLNDRKFVPYTVFLTPQFSRVGMTEKEALERGYEILINTTSAVHPVMKISNETDGLLKAVVDKKTHKILGATLFMARSAEVINTIALAMRMDADYSVLADGVFTHPSATEMLNELFSNVK